MECEESCDDCELHCEECGCEDCRMEQAIEFWESLREARE